MTQLLIHIGPFKTGTTSFQDYMWHHRKKFLKKGVLYPKTGIYSKNFGARHLLLARSPKEKMEKLYPALREEIAAHPDAKKVVLSAERFSQRMPQLVEKREFYEEFNPKIVVAVREEVSMVRSMYLQIAQSRFRFMREQQADDLQDFPKWFEGYKHRLCYPIMLKPWIDAFGAESVIYVPYEAHRKVNIITSLCEAMDIPQLAKLKASKFQNPSIGGLAAAAGIYAAKYGPKNAKRALEFASLLEQDNPELKKINPKGYDAEAMRAYYTKKNAPAFKKYPEFKKAHDAATSRD